MVENKRKIRYVACPYCKRLISLQQSKPHVEAYHRDKFDEFLKEFDKIKQTAIIKEVETKTKTHVKHKDKPVVNSINTKEIDRPKPASIQDIIKEETDMTKEEHIKPEVLKMPPDSVATDEQKGKEGNKPPKNEQIVPTKQSKSFWDTPIDEILFGDD